MTLLSLHNLTVKRGECPVVDDVSLTVGEGEFVGLLGPNGAGKTSLLRGALGLLAASGQSSLAVLAPWPAPGRRLSCRRAATSPGRSAWKPWWRWAARRMGRPTRPTPPLPARWPGWGWRPTAAAAPPPCRGASRPAS
ncbi:MAG: ATP-binding cassette domain-containing protein [Rhodobacter sp.]|nr:ATP-binding cassette domain-containing protein [Rhodobacter sp.]